MRNPMKIFWVVLGFMCLGLGTVGIVLPLLPTVPFYMAVVFCFAKSSQRLHDWFVGTSLYKNNLETYVNDRAMTMVNKLRIVCTASFIMFIGFLCMENVLIGRVCIAIVWLGHLIYFFGRVRTIPSK